MSSQQSAKEAFSSPLIDVHTHMYPPAYLALLRSRSSVPYLLDLPAPAPPRLIILPSDDDPGLPPDQRGRPIDETYSSVACKIAFMDTHGIKTSIISLANPWLDFLSASESPAWAEQINDEFQTLCSDSADRLYAFGTLPFTASPARVITEIERLQKLPRLKGVIMGTGGLGTGLDDPSLDEVWCALERTETMVFLHPHYGLPTGVFGPRAANYGHVLPLALGFPLETTIAFSRMYLSRVFDRFPRLKLLIAHAGGTVPFLAGRLESCVEHERQFLDSVQERIQKPQRNLAEVLRSNIWLDAVTYSETGVKAAVSVVGMERVLFGTDHPFFPPLEAKVEHEWQSVKTNVAAVRKAYSDDEGSYEKIIAENARHLFDISSKT